MVGFIQGEDFSYAGEHLLIDFFDCEYVPEAEELKTFLTDVCEYIGATVMFSHAHEFGDGGSSGVIILAESHCTWHYWIEEKYLAIDIFVCGDCKTKNALTKMLQYFKPAYTKSNKHYRGESN